jgi:NAD(P)-dependent dehydrogenase (short-subunit alcohol dehydrogenase family)
MSGRVALITGGTRGLGRTIAERLAADGFVPALLYRSDRPAAEEAVAALPGARAYEADISDRAQVDAAVARVNAELGPVRVLINNAYRAGRTPKKTHEVDPVEFAEDIATNLVGQFHVTRACIPSMLDGAWGRIVFIGSIAVRGERGRVAYASAKSALIGFAKTIALEYAKEGITSNIVSPGFIESGVFLRFSEEIRERALKLVPAKRAGQASEVAAAVSYLCSDDAAYTTGQVLTIDGGTTI